VPVLQYLWKKVIDGEMCSTLYKGTTKVDQQQLCAGGKKGQDSCNGDSGGPLARPGTGEPDGDGYYTLVGVVSFGTRLCGSGGLPGVYANVAAYLDWIRSVTREGWSPREEARALWWNKPRVTSW